MARRRGYKYGGFNPLTGRPKSAPKPKKAYRAPAPKTQPGPYRATERRTVERATGRSRPAPKRQPGPISERERRTKIESRRGRRAVRKGVRAVRRANARRERALALLETRRALSGLGLKQDRDLKVAGINVDAITGKAGRGAVDVLEETLRPTYALAGASDAALKGKNVLKAAERGFAKKDRKTFSDVLKTAGIDNVPVPLPGGTTVKVPREAAGFVLDVGLDPTTYVTGGVGSVATKAAAKAGTKTVARRAAQRKSGELREPAVKQTGAGAKAERKAYRKARAEGRSPQAAKQAAEGARRSRDVARQQRRVRTLDTRAANRAGRRAERKAPKGRGVQVGVGKYRTSGKLTRLAAEPLRRLPDTAVSRTARELGSTFSPHIRPPGTGAKEFSTMKAAAREARAAATRGTQRAANRAIAIAKAIPPRWADEVRDAIERGTVYNLARQLTAEIRRTKGRPANAAERAEIEQTVTAARMIEREFKAARKAEARAGIKTGQVSGVRYFTHTLDEALGQGRRRGGGGTTIRAGYAKERAHRGTARQIEEAGGPAFSKNIPTVVGDRLARSAQDVSRAKLAQAVAEAGRKITPGQGDIKIGKDEGVFHVTDGKVTPLDLRDAETKRMLGRVGTGEFKGAGDFVVANEEFIRRQLHGVTPTSDYGVIRRAYDKTTGGFKYLVTVPNPGFHMRNLQGDTVNAWLAQPAVGVVANATTAVRVLRRVARQEQAQRGTVKRALGGKVTVRDPYGRKQQVSLDRLGREAEKHGAIRQGFMGRELPELWKQGKTGVKVRKGRAARAGRGLQLVLQSREDLMRLATYIGARKSGLPPREAADRVARHHFDYGDLSAFEREVMRRLLPFYTFTARNVPLQAKSLVQRPGKFATVEKARTELAKAQGIDLVGWEEDLKQYQLYGVPFPIRVGDDVYAIGSQNMMPMADLAKVPFPGVGFDQTLANQWDTFAGLLNPIVRTPLELSTNYNYFFKGPIETEYAPLVRAPSFVQHFPDSWKKRLGIVPDWIDKRTGEKGWAWPAKVDYVSKVVSPGPVGAAVRLSERGESRAGQGDREKALSYFGGVRAERVDPPGARIGRLMDAREDLTKRRGALSQRGIGSADSGKRETREYRQVRDRLKRLEEEVTRLSSRRGDVVPLFGRGGSAPKSLQDELEDFKREREQGGIQDEFREYLKTGR